jgi:hypothetical protein
VTRIVGEMADRDSESGFRTASVPQSGGAKHRSSIVTTELDMATAQHFLESTVARRVETPGVGKGYRVAQVRLI